MKSLSTYILLCVVFSLHLINSVLASELSSPTLNFVNSEETIRWSYSDIGPNTPLPKYAVGFYDEFFNDNADFRRVRLPGGLFEISPGRAGQLEKIYIRSQWGTPQKFLDFAFEQVSTQQREFMTAIQPGLFTIRQDLSSNTEYLFWAVSQEDAQKMAQAYLRFSLDDFNQQKEALESQIENITKAIADTEKRIKKIEEQIAHAKEALPGVRQDVPYRTINQAMEAIREFNKMLSAISVEISGIRSAIETIQEFQNNQQLSDDTQVRLEEMLIEQSVALHSAQAREKTANELRIEAREFIDLTDMVESGPQRIRELQNELRNHTSQLERRERLLSEMVSPEIKNNTVTIYRVVHSSPADN